MSTTRCPYCHDACSSGDGHPACDGCLARAHEACWDELGACAACGGTERLSAPRPRSRRSPWLGRIVLSGGLALVGAPAVGLIGPGSFWATLFMVSIVTVLALIGFAVVRASRGDRWNAARAGGLALLVLVPATALNLLAYGALEYWPGWFMLLVAGAGVLQSGLGSALRVKKDAPAKTEAQPVYFGRQLPQKNWRLPATSASTVS